MQNLLHAQRKLLPDLLDIMQRRYQVLRLVREMQPVGRRSLASNIQMSERVLRAEAEFLKEQNLLSVSSIGMMLTDDGYDLLVVLEEMMKDVSGIKQLEKELKNKLGVEQVVIISGDSDLSPFVVNEMGRACVSLMKKYMRENEIIAVAGGTTLATVADMMTPSNKQPLFVVARGGLGEDVTIQANTVCAKMAEKSLGSYRLLHVPDQLSVDAYQSMIEEPSIKEVLHLIQLSSMVIHGIGDAKTMATRRKMNQVELEKLERHNAVAESFGYYFNEDGEVVHKVTTMGIQLEDLKKIAHVIVVAGGTSKAKAIKAYMKQAHTSILITDEGAARKLILE